MENDRSDCLTHISLYIFALACRRVFRFFGRTLVVVLKLEVLLETRGDEDHTILSPLQLLKTPSVFRPHLSRK